MFYIQRGPLNGGILEKRGCGKNKAHLIIWSILIYAKKTVFAVFAMSQKVRLTKELSRFTGIIERTVDSLTHIRPGSDCIPPRYLHTAKPYQKKGNRS